MEKQELSAVGAALTAEEVLALPASVPLWPTVGRAFGMSRSHTYALAARGDLPVKVMRIGGRWRVTRSALLAALAIEEPSAAGGGRGE